MAKINSIKEILTHDFLVNWLSTATYGNYILDAFIHNDTPDDVYQQAKKNNHTREDIWADVLLNNGIIGVYDNEEEEEYKITLNDIEKGIETFMLNQPKQWEAIVDETMDFYDADALLQWIIFGEVVYG